MPKEHQSLHRGAGPESARGPGAGVNRGQRVRYRNTPVRSLAPERAPNRSTGTTMKDRALRQRDRPAPHRLRGRPWRRRWLLVRRRLGRICPARSVSRWREQVQKQPRKFPWPTLYASGLENSGAWQREPRSRAYRPWRYRTPWPTFCGAMQGRFSTLASCRRSPRRTRANRPPGRPAPFEIPNFDPRSMGCPPADSPAVCPAREP